MVIPTDYKAVSKFEIIPQHTFNEVEIKKMLLVALFLELNGTDIKYILKNMQYPGRTALVKEFTSLSRYGSPYNRPFIKEKVLNRYDRKAVDAAKADWSQIISIINSYPNIEKFIQTLIGKFNIVDIINSLPSLTPYTTPGIFNSIGEIFTIMNEDINQKQFKLIIEF